MSRKLTPGLGKSGMVRILSYKQNKNTTTEKRGVLSQPRDKHKRMCCRTRSAIIVTSSVTARVIVHGPLPSSSTQRFALHHARGLSAPATGARCAVEATRRGDPGARRRGRRGRSLRERRIYLSQKRIARDRPPHTLSAKPPPRAHGGFGRALLLWPRVLGRARTARGRARRGAQLSHRRSG